MIFETHAHYDDEAFQEDREEILRSLPEQGIGYVVNVSSGFLSVDTTIALTKKYSYIYGAVGIHPEELDGMNEERLAWLREKAKQPKIVAVGEIGLDYYWDKTNHENQKLWFSRQMEMAKKLKLPIIVHSRDAANDTCHLIKEAKAEDTGAVIHCFSYGLEQAKQYLEMGFYLGIGGVVTFTNGRRLKEVVSYAPLEQLLLETDCPYLSPVPHRGERNSSLNLPYMVKEIASLKKIDYDTVIKVTCENAKRFYKI